MHLKPWNIAILLLLAFSLFPSNIVSADVGPKPGMSFDFTQDFTGAPVTIVSGTLYQCEEADCQDAQPLEQLGPQGFHCDVASCSALAYGFSTYNQLEIQFSDGKTRRSNVFETAGFNSSYKVTIRQDDLLVEAKPSFNLFSTTTLIILCGGCLGLLIIIVVVIVLLVRRASKKQ